MHQQRAWCCPLRAGTLSKIWANFLFTFFFFPFLPPQLYYRDDEDLVVLETDADFLEAARFLATSGGKCLHVYTSRNHSGRSVDTTSTASAPSTTVETGNGTSLPDALPATLPANAAPLIASLMQGIIQQQRQPQPQPQPQAQAQPQPQKEPNASKKAPIEAITGLAHSPQGAQFLSMLGLTPSMVGPILKGEQDFPPHIVGLMRNFGITPEAARAMLGSGGPNSGVENSNNGVTPSVDQEKGVSICDICDAPIASDEIKWGCTVCEDFDMHAKCRAEHANATGHLLTTEHATPERLAQLMSVGFERDLCIHALNMNQGNVEEALNTLVASLKDE